MSEASITTPRVRELRRLDVVIDVTFWALLTVGSARYVAVHSADAVLGLVGSLVVAAAAGYAVSSLSRRGSLREKAGLAAAVLAWGALTIAAPSFGWAAVPVFFAVRRVFTGIPALMLSSVVPLALGVGLFLMSGATDIAALIGVVGSGIALSMTFSTLDRLLAARGELARQLLRAQDQLAQSERAAGVASERQRIAAELHDSVAQGTASAVLLLEAAEETWRSAPERSHVSLTKARSALRESLAETRRILDAEPREVEGSLVAELENSAALFGARLDVVGRAVTLAPDVEYALFRVAHEALTNASRHADAARIVVTLTYDSDAVSVDVGDDGRGFSPDSQRGGRFGMQAMRWRMESIGGSLAIDSATGRGTIVTARMPRGVTT